MKAWVYERYGSPEVLELRNVDVPAMKDDEVLVRVVAAGANAADRHLLRGEPRLVRLAKGLTKPRRPAIAGSDVAGVIDATGRAVTRFRPGDEVYAEVDTGGFAEYVSVRERFVAHKPTTLTFEQAAAIPMAGLTALQGLRDRGRIEAGQQVLINGASGGVGTSAVQLAKAFGTEVTGVCSMGNLELVRSIGADHVVDYTNEDVIRGERRFDLILDTVGTHTLKDYRLMMTRRATYVGVGWIDLRFLRPKLAGALLSLLVSQRFVTLLTRRSGEDLAFLAHLIDRGELVPVIDRVFELSAVPEAMRYLVGGHVRGKLVVTI